MKRSGLVLLTRSDVARLMNLNDYLTAAEEAFRGLATGRIHTPLPMHLEGNGGGFHVKGATIAGDSHHAAVKLNSNFPDNPFKRSLPTIQGAILLADANDGSLLAIMDSMEITLQRTAAATALAAQHLARPDASTLCICGCGTQAPAQMRALANVFPLRRVMVWDTALERARQFAADYGNDPNVVVHAAFDLEEATRGSDLIVTCTTATAPFLGASAVSEGAFIAAVGADSPTKSEIEADLMARSIVVTDVREQCLVMGDLHHAVAAGKRSRDERYVELGDVVVGRQRPRVTDSDIVIFDSTGTAAQDLTATLRVYQRACAVDCSAHFDFAK